MSHAVHNPRTIDSGIERRIIELRREHPDWGKKRMGENGRRAVEEKYNWERMEEKLLKLYRRLK